MDESRELPFLKHLVILASGVPRDAARKCPDDWLKKFPIKEPIAPHEKTRINLPNMQAILTRYNTKARLRNFPSISRCTQLLDEIWGRRMSKPTDERVEWGDFEPIHDVDRVHLVVARLLVIQSGKMRYNSVLDHGKTIRTMFASVGVTRKTAGKRKFGLYVHMAVDALIRSDFSDGRIVGIRFGNSGPRLAVKTETVRTQIVVAGSGERRERDGWTVHEYTLAEFDFDAHGEIVGCHEVEEETKETEVADDETNTLTRRKSPKKKSRRAASPRIAPSTASKNSKRTLSDEAAPRDSMGMRAKSRKSRKRRISSLSSLPTMARHVDGPTPKKRRAPSARNPRANSRHRVGHGPEPSESVPSSSSPIERTRKEEEQFQEFLVWLDEEAHLMRYADLMDKTGHDSLDALQFFADEEWDGLQDVSVGHKKKLKRKADAWLRKHSS